MAITWDAPLTSVVAVELARRLGPREGRRRGARLRAFLLDHDALSLLLWWREATLVFRLRPDAGAVLLLDAAEPLDRARPLAAELEGVEAPPDDRVLLFRLRKVRGGRERFTVAVELMTNQWNAVVAEGPERRVRHVLRERSPGDRTLAVGSVYEPPTPSDRSGRDGELTESRWFELLGDVEPAARRGALLSSVAWTSSLNADAILGDAVGDLHDRRGEALEEARRRWSKVAAVACGRAEPEPVLLLRPQGPQPYPLPLPGTDWEAEEDVLQALRAAAERGEVGPAAPVPSAWVDALEKRLHGARGRIRGLERELEAAPAPEEVRALGDLILARYQEVPRGAERAVLDDFEGGRVEVELDPALSPDENAARYYDEASRAERARERIPELVSNARAEATRLEDLLRRVKAGEAATEEVRAALPETEGADARTDPGPSLPYHRYRSTGGLEIRVGRGARQNDDLTFHHSRPDDVWLHARHAAGAHVILRWDGEDNPPARDLAEAAVLAALHSKARTSGSVPVDWTRRKYVRSPRNAPPGSVVPDRVQTVFVEPDERLEERLRDE